MQTQTFSEIRDFIPTTPLAAANNQQAVYLVNVFHFHETHRELAIYVKCLREFIPKTALILFYEPIIEWKGKHEPIITPNNPYTRAAFKAFILKMLEFSEAPLWDDNNLTTAQSGEFIGCLAETINGG